ncbi:MAG: PRC-barrel domain-containing protein, partial [Pusillimonas sp.]
PAPMPAPGPDAGAGGAAMPGADAPPKEEEVVETITGWSVKDKIIGNAVYNEGDEKIGNISDVVLASDGKAAYFIVGAGGFLGLGERNVAIPFEEITQNGDKLILAGYTKDQLKALPKVEVTP